MQEIQRQIEAGRADFDYELKGGILFFRRRFCVGSASPLWQLILEELHSSRIGGHSGHYRTLQRVRQNFFWRGMTKFVRDFVSHCLICQQTKALALKPMGLLHPLPIPMAVWDDLIKFGLHHWLARNRGAFGYNCSRGSFD